MCKVRTYGLPDNNMLLIMICLNCSIRHQADLGPTQNRKPELSEPFHQEPKGEPLELFFRNRHRNRALLSKQHGTQESPVLRTARTKNLNHWHHSTLKRTKRTKLGPPWKVWRGFCFSYWAKQAITDPRRQAASNIAVADLGANHARNWGRDHHLPVRSKAEKRSSLRISFVIQANMRATIQTRCCDTNSGLTEMVQEAFPRAEKKWGGKSHEPIRKQGPLSGTKTLRFTKR